MSSLPRFEQSPFTPEIRKGNKPIVASRIGETYSSLTGELISDNVKVVVTKSMDRSEFVKFFTKQLSLLIEIDPSEIKVFLYLCKNLSKDTGKARFNMDDVRELTGYTKPTIYRALSKLCQRQFIAKTMTSKNYWVNSSIAFNGSRMSIL